MYRMIPIHSTTGTPTPRTTRRCGELRCTRRNRGSGGCVLLTLFDNAASQANLSFKFSQCRHWVLAQFAVKHSEITSSGSVCGSMFASCFPPILDQLLHF